MCVDERGSLNVDDSTGGGWNVLVIRQTGLAVDG